MILELRLKALTDLCLSASNHTLGQPDTHDYIPGRTLWGAVATLAYRSGMDEKEAFRLFHQGAIRIFDGVPALGDSRTYPAPRSWHQQKDSKSPEYLNFAHKQSRSKALAGEKQFKPGPDQWVSPMGLPVELDRNFSLRTAVDPSGRASEGLLYGLPTLPAGCEFATRIEGDEADIRQVKSLLEGAILRLGRSRNSELGAVKVSIRKKGHEVLKCGTGKNAQISILCISRVILRDSSTGQPTVIPTAEDLGLPKDWQFDVDHSFVRTTTIVHFNSKRKRPEPERFALERGSVLTFKGREALAVETIQAALSDGVGEFTGQGYGEVLVAPNWLTEEKVSIQPKAKVEAVQARPPKDELFGWAEQKAQDKLKILNLYETATSQAANFRRFRVPSSQWGVLRAKAREARFCGGEGLFKDIFGETGFLETGKRGLSGPWKRAKRELMNVCEEQKADLPIFLEQLASACMRPDFTEPAKKETTHV